MKGSASVGKITCSEGLEGGKGEGGRRKEEEGRQEGRRRQNNQEMSFVQHKFIS